MMDIQKQKQGILQERARVLAKELKKDADAQGFLEIVEFRLAGETYGIASAFVSEVYPLKAFTPLPGIPPFVLGIIHVRGRILSIVDLKVFFNLPQKGLGNLNKLIILENERMTFGVLADVVLGVRLVPFGEIQDLPLGLSGIGAKYLKGITIEGVAVLNAEKILMDDQIIIHQEVWQESMGEC